MKKIFISLFALAAVLSFSVLRQETLALSAGKMLVSPVNVPTAQSSYGVYPNTLDMISNDIINSINKYSSFDVPDLNSSKSLIKSYGLSKDYKDFLMSYRDNRVVDSETCNLIGKTLGVDKILLVSGGYDVQNLFLNKPDSSKLSEICATTLPFTRIFSKDLIFAGLPFIGSHIYNNIAQDDPIKPYYRLNVQLALIDTDTGLVIWEKSYNREIPASDFGNPINSFGENVISTEKLKDFSDKISRETSYEVFMTSKNSEYTSVKSSIVTSQKDQEINNKTLPRDGKLTRDGQLFSTSLENKRKESYKNWIKDRAKY